MINFIFAFLGAFTAFGLIELFRSEKFKRRNTKKSKTESVAVSDNFEEIKKEDKMIDQLNNLMCYNGKPQEGNND